MYDRDAGRHALASGPAEKGSGAHEMAWRYLERVLAVPLLVAVLAACDQQGDEETARREEACGESARVAYSIVKKYLQAELKPGSKASFPALSKVRAEKPSTNDPCQWVIYGYLDIENAKGKEYQRKYIASIHYEGDNRWRMSDLELK